MAIAAAPSMHDLDELTQEFRSSPLSVNDLFELAEIFTKFTYVREDESGKTISVGGPPVRETADE